MRIIYPSISANEYVELVKDRKAEEGIQNPAFIGIVAGIGAYCICQVSVVFFLFLFDLDGIIWSFFLSLFAGFMFFLWVRKELEKGRKTKTAGVSSCLDPEMLRYYSLCDTFRRTGIRDVSLHLEDDRCDMEAFYKDCGKQKKADVSMSWHLSKSSEDLIIDFERRDVAIPEKLIDDVTK